MSAEPHADSSNAAPEGHLVIPAHQRDQVDDWVAQIAGHSPRLVLADGDDQRATAAADWLVRHTAIRPILIRTRGVPRPAASPRDESALHTQDVETLGADPSILACLATRRDGSRREAEDIARVAADPVYLAAVEVAIGRADGCVAGAARPTADVLRAALSVIGLSVSSTTVSSSFLMAFPDGRRMAYGDCAVLPAPDRDQLAQVAVDTAHTYLTLTGDQPVVAMLSFSTKGSARHAEVDLVRAATEIARNRRPDFLIDGELQLDAAIVDSVGRAKAPRSEVAGRANVLIFPTLSAGNIGYKMSERLAHASAFGPILQGLAAPMNDLSRGCSASDIVSVALITAVQSLIAGEEPQTVER